MAGSTRGLAAFWADRGRIFRKLFFESLFFQFLAMLGRFGQVLGSQNGSQNRFLGAFLSMLFSNAFRHRFLMVVGRLKT